MSDHPRGEHLKAGSPPKRSGFAPRSWRLEASVLGSLLVSLISGCAYVHIGADGQRHMIGFVNLRLARTEGAPSQPSVETIRTRTVGLSLHRTGMGSDFSLGYADTMFATLGGNTCVRQSFLRTGQP